MTPDIRNTLAAALLTDVARIIATATILATQPETSALLRRVNDHAHTLAQRLHADSLTPPPTPTDLTADPL